MIKYKIIVDQENNEEATVGRVVYPLLKTDWCLAREDTEESGVECTSVTFNEDGDYPGFVIARDDIQRILD